MLVAMSSVSVVLIFLDAERFMREAVQSVIDQTMTDWELILVDDGSRDRSREIAQDLAVSDDRITYCHHPNYENRGMSASRNLGASHGSGRYIAFLDADDVWLPNKLSEQTALLDEMPDVAMVVGAPLYWYSWEPSSTLRDQVIHPAGFQDERLEPPDAALELYPLKRRPGGVIGGLIRRSAFDAVGGYEDRFRSLYEDQALYLKLYLQFPIFISSRTWMRYRQLDASCCGRSSRGEAWRRRGEFLVWLQESDDLARTNDTRVGAAVRRRRREIPFLLAVAPVVEVVDRLRERATNRLSI
ncbi:glycosyltransferase family 2 protein [Mycolicibacterium palauense]|uniref:glycosyltransferase family 2 protein n=1 Tax=Mycolicibacterium palauense TaxID=2034511 RepID=UPI0038993A73